MSRFICALATADSVPTALALVEATEGPAPRYSVRHLRALDASDPIRDVTDLLASEPQFVAQSTVVTTGGQAAADAVHAAGPSAVAVTVSDGAADADAHGTTTQDLVDTFVRLYRAGAIEIDATLDGASEALDSFYTAADLEAVAPESDRDALDEERVQALNGVTYQGDGPDAAVIEQSGSEAPVSTETIERPISPAEATAAAVDAQVSESRAATTGAGAPDIDDLATALALACWFGEASRDALPVTDQADEALANRVNRPDRRN